MYPWLAIALTFIASFAQSSFGGIGDTIVVNFRQNAETNFVPVNASANGRLVALCNADGWLYQDVLTWVEADGRRTGI